MRDRGLERRFGCGARGIDVNPLAIVGRLGEPIDPLLCDLNPVADGDLLTEAIAQGGEVGALRPM